MSIEILKVTVEDGEDREYGTEFFDPSERVYMRVDGEHPEFGTVMVDIAIRFGADGLSIESSEYGEISTVTSMWAAWDEYVPDPYDVEADKRG